MGIGSENCVRIPVDFDARIKIDALRTLLQERLDKKQAVYGVVAVIGSTEEGAVSSVPGYVCCSFVGNIVALRFTRSKGFTKVWDVAMLPPPADGANSTDRWSGASVWGSQPSIDEKRNQVFIGTGNTYKTPTSYSQCLSANNGSTTTTLGNLSNSLNYYQSFAAIPSQSSTQIGNGKASERLQHRDPHLWPTPVASTAQIPTPRLRATSRWRWTMLRSSWVVVV